MSRSSKDPVQSFNDATGKLYWGAAFLVLLLGLRSIAETSSIGENADFYLTLLAVGSIVVEFYFLIRYGNHVRKRTPTKMHITGGNDLTLVNEKLHEIAEAFTGISEELRTLTERSYRDRIYADVINALESSIKQLQSNKPSRLS